MPFPIFAPSVDPMPGSIEVEPRTLQPPFGVGFSRAIDGVKQTIYSGDIPSNFVYQVNSQPQVLPAVTWENISTSEKDEIISFVQERAGYLPFTWTIPGQTQAFTYICKKWSRERIAADVWRVALHIEQVFDLG